MKLTLSWVLLIAGCGGLLAIGCARPAESTADKKDSTEEKDVGQIAAMGVEFKYIIYGTTRQIERARPIIRTTLEALEQTFSDYRQDSEAQKLSDASPQAEPVEVSPWMWDLCRKSQALAERSRGAFDITVGPVSHLWRAAIKRNRLPDEKAIAAALARVDRQQLKVLDNRRMQLTGPEMQLDFGGIAKGYAADILVEQLTELGIQRILIDASGDITVRGTPPDRDSWRLELPPLKNIHPIVLGISQGAVATSGNSKQSLVIDGQRFSHIVDPRTGQAVTKTWRVTVLAPTGTEADAWASAFSVLAPEEAFALAEQLTDIEAQIVFESAPGADLGTLQTQGFARAVEEILLYRRR